MIKFRVAITLIAFFMVSASSTSLPISEVMIQVHKYYNNKEGIKLPKISANKISKIFNVYGYDIRNVARNKKAPQIYITQIPNDLDKISDVKRKKELFVEMMLPNVLKVNNEILAERKEFLEVFNKIKKNQKITDEERNYIEEKAKKYKVKSKFFPSNEQRYINLVEELDYRINYIPVSLAIAQAAIESGWGQSRFAKEGNSLFGQWSWDGTGIIPKDREEGESYRVKTFKDIQSAVRSYALNLNSHLSYKQFRINRYLILQRQNFIYGKNLVPNMILYSQLREKYLGLLKSVINSNKLTLLDRASLDNSPLKEPSLEEIKEVFMIE
jgi:Bax protein